MEYSVWNVAPIFLLPFFSFFITAAIVKKAEKLAVFISCASIFGSFIYAFRIFLDFMNVYSANYHIHRFFNWIDLSFGSQIFKIDLGIYIDNMSAVMLLMVTGVAFLIHLFSTFYMAEDARFGRFFVYLSLFTSAMLGLVLSDNLLTVFIFWEIMGFCSYSLIGFYYEKESAGNASIKAFMTTRVGDVFFLVGILAIWTIVGSVSFPEIYSAIADGKFAGEIIAFGFGIPVATFIAFSVFMGTIGKSAQFPLFVWLPDAMQGPTPCSALIHAATMVAAGVYLSLRMYPMMEIGHLTTFIAYIGGITAFGAATIALVQTDIKAVLAFSTISQLGYMVLGVGVGAYNAAFMHLITHAVFKACLFLASGSVIHSLHDHHTHGHVQEMPRMGGLRKKMPFTFFAMLCCSFAIAGVPFFSGFVSKDRILGESVVQSIMHNSDLWGAAALGFLGALLTAFYMFRMMFLTFFGEPRDKELYDHCHKETFSFNRNLPLIILTVFTLGIWFSGSLTGQGIVKVASHKLEWFSTLIEKPKVEEFKHYQKLPWFEGGIIDRTDFEPSHHDANHGMNEEEAHHVHHIHHVGAIVSIIIAFLGIFFAYLMYIKKAFNPEKWVRTFPRWTKALHNLYYFNDFYVKVMIEKVLFTMNNVSGFIDVQIIDRFFVDSWFAITRFWFKIARFVDDVFVDTIAVDGTGACVRLFNVVLRTLQSGKIQFYFLMIIIVLSSYIWSLKF